MKFGNMAPATMLLVVSLALLVNTGAATEMPSHLFKCLFTYPTKKIVQRLHHRVEDTVGETLRDFQYEVAFDTLIPNIAMLGGIPPVGELPTWKWLQGLLNKTANIAHSYLDTEKSKMIIAAIPEIIEKAASTQAEEAVLKLHSIVDDAKGVMTSSNVFELAWHITLAEKALSRRVALNGPHLSGSIAKLVKDLVLKLIDVVLTAFMAPDNARPVRFEGYSNLFKSLLKYYPEPESNRETGVDAAFGRYRLGGWVPFQLRKVDTKLLHDMHFRQYRGSSHDLIKRVEKALRDGRLYGTDYSFLAALPRQPGKFAAQPVGLFEIPEDEEEGERVGVSPLCVQVTKGVASSIFTPSDGKWVWQYAKMTFNAMESVYHEGIGHLAHTHLVVEALLLSIKRSMPPKHPVRKLVDPHLEGTIFINWLAEQTLLKDGGPVDIQFPTQMKPTLDFIASEVLDRMKSNLTWPAFMEKSGLTEGQFPVKYYPYREFAGKLWAAYHRWVGRYLKLVYPSNKKLNADSQLEEFRRELIANKVKWVEDTWFEGQGTVALLTDVITSTIFIGSAQHAAVNFAQAEMMSPAGWVPRALYSPPQNDAAYLENEEDILNALPPIRQSLLQRDVALILSTHYTNILDGYSKPAYDTVEMDRAARDFHQELVEIEAYQNERNAEAVDRWRKTESKPKDLNPDHWAYNLLLPSMVPMSINI
ncbi:Linoleate 9/13-lipoxygenase [Diplonema papillatum]|nr:Linoleate 9/13-lipoxygenase [Diplonema papillatum]